MTRSKDKTGAIGALVDAAERYLATLSGPGLAEVRAGIATWRDGPATPTGAMAVNGIVERHLSSALNCLVEEHPALARAIADAASALRWQTYDRYPLAEIGSAFAEGHAYARIIGNGAAIPAHDFDLGLFLIAPNAFYRDHCHPAPELYVPLTGPHGWRFAPGAPLVMKDAHEPVWNPPNRPHAMKIGPNPFLCFYGWTRDVDLPARVLPANDWSQLEALRLAA